MIEPVYVGIDVGGTNLRSASFIGQSATPARKRKVPTRQPATHDTILDELAHAVEAVLPPGVSHPAAVGVAIPGPVNPRTGVIVIATNLKGWENLPLGARLSERLGCPIVVGNDANLAAVGEWKFGAAAGYHDVLYLTVSTGIGGGIIAADRLLLGVNGLAGEVGHIQVEPDGQVCNCGQVGCLETVAAGPAIARNAVARLQAGECPDSALRAFNYGDVSRLTTLQIGQAAAAGDSFAREQIGASGTRIGRAVASMAALFNPAVVVIGGGVSFTGELFMRPLREAVAASGLPETYWRDMPIVHAALGDDAGLIGAAAAAMGTA